MSGKVYFVGAGPGDPDLITVKGKELLQKADVVLYTGSLIPKTMLKWTKSSANVVSSEDMSYEDIFNFIEQNVSKGLFVRLHTGDPTLFSTIAKQISFLKSKQITYEVIPGVSAGFGASSALGIEYTIPGVSQNLILTRVAGKTPNPEPLINILRCTNSSLVFYLSINLLDKLITEALGMGYSKTTPCWAVIKACWADQEIIKGTLEDIQDKVKNVKVKGPTLILLGNFLNQSETETSRLYNI